MSSYESVNQNCHPNVSHDTFKFLCHIYNVVNIPEIKHKIESYFPSHLGKSLLIEGDPSIEYISKPRPNIKNDPPFRYYLINKPLISSEMYSTEKILIDLKNEIIKFPTSSSEIAETYSTKDLFKSKSKSKSIFSRMKSMSKKKSNKV